MKLQPPDDQPFPVQRAFVVQGHATAAVAQGPLTGRVAHVLSGQAVHFQPLDELLAFIARVLTRLDAAMEEPPSAGAPYPYVPETPYTYCIS